MRYLARIKTNKPVTRVLLTEQRELIISVTSSAIEGKANAAVIKAVADFFNVSRQDITIISGFTSKTKIIEVSVGDSKTILVP